MDSHETLDFAQALMNEIWLPLDPGPVPRFYHRDVVGWNRRQRLSYDDVVHRLVTDRPRFRDPKYDIQDIIAAEDKFAIRFYFTSTLANGQPANAEANYFYHLRDGRISEFWLLADIAFDYKADD
jgi:predicted ester cyclase